MNKKERQRQRRQAQAQSQPQAPSGADVLPRPQGIDAQERELRRDNENAKRGNESRLREWIVAGVGIATLLCVAFQSCVMRGQLSQMERGADQTERIIAQSQDDARAWIGVGDIDFPAMRAGEWLTIEVHIKNVGRAPATKIIAQGGAAYAPAGISAPPPPTFISKLPRGEYGALFPDVDRTITLDDRRAMTQEFIDGVNSGKVSLWLIGEITYDTYKPGRITHFFYKYDAKSGKWKAEQTYNDAN